jgi:hypothetical protein
MLHLSYLLLLFNMFTFLSPHFHVLYASFSFYCVNSYLPLSFILLLFLLMYPFQVFFAFFFPSVLFRLVYNFSSLSSSVPNIDPNLVRMSRTGTFKFQPLSPNVGPESQCVVIHTKA